MCVPRRWDNVGPTDEVTTLFQWIRVRCDRARQFPLVVVRRAASARSLTCAIVGGAPAVASLSRLPRNADTTRMRQSPLLAVLVSFLARPADAPASRGDDLNGSEFTTRAAAQAHMDAHPGHPYRLDGNGTDGRAGGSLPAGGGSSPPPPPPSHKPAPTPPPPTPQCSDGASA